MKKAFTLIELVVAVALLAMMLGFASVIFRVSIEAYRTAGANTEIMQKLRAVTDQLNADFKGQIWNAPGRIRFGFGNSDINGEIVQVRSDSIVFFANGDFQSTGQYPYMKSGGGEGLKTISGNVATIFYGLADVTGYDQREKYDPKKKILVRRQTILAADSSLKNDLVLDPPGEDQPGEYCNTKSLSELIADEFDANDIMDKPNLDPNDEDDLVMYMAKGVDDFTIQYVGLDYDEFGNLVEEFEFNEWRPVNKDIRDAPVEWEGKSFAPLAFKFTFTLYDSKGIIERGREFTHIVYLGD